MTPSLDALLFDKDGTLFDFRATWDAWAAAELRALAGGDVARLTAMAGAIGFDLAGSAFRPDSLVVAGTNREVAEALLPHVATHDLASLERALAEGAARAPLAPAVPLAPLMDRLRAAGFRLGVMTNDSAHAAEAHLGAAGIRDRLDFVAGSDSGFGGKPMPEPLLAFASEIRVAPSRVAMIGDSAHDLVAGRAAGMVTVGVLTGTATHGDLASLADVVLPDIGHLPKWLGLE